MSPIRGVLGSLAIAVLTIVGSVAAIVSRLFDRTGDTVLDLARLWARIILGLFGVRVEVTGAAAIDAGQPYVFMANHSSAIDIWAVLLGLPVHVRMIAKKQLGYIPLFGWAMRAGRFIFIDRGNAVRARRSIELAKERIRGGQSVLLFPEGTRTRDGRLLPFKKGGFLLAIDAGVPIVPIAIVGAHELMPPGRLALRPGHVTLRIGAPVPTAGLTAEDRNDLLERVRGEIAALLEAGPAEPLSHLPPVIQ
jgi:1-acyl-sn-glycerol-3-phosphate acyltransferase